MNVERLHALCASLPGATTDCPFEPDVPVWRVGGRIFALVVATPPRVSLKCDPAFAEILRRTYAGVTPGYHLNKRHWNTVLLDAGVPAERVEEMVRHSYEQVLAGLSRGVRRAIGIG